MAQNLELIVDLLKEMRRADNTNSERFEKLLAALYTKLEFLQDNETSIELIKDYLTVQTRTVSQRNSIILSNFDNIDDAINSVIKKSDEHGKNKSLNKFLSTFSKNLKELHKNEENQRKTVEEIESLLESLNTLTKDEVIHAVAEIKNKLEQLNEGIKNCSSNLTTNTKSIITALLKTELTEDEENSKNIQVIQDSVKRIVTYIQSINERDFLLEKLLSNIATNESLKLTRGVIDSIIEKSEEISQKITTLADKSDIETIKESAKTIDKKLDSSITKEEFTKITLKTEDLVNHTDEVKQTLAKVTKNIETLPNTKILEESLQNLFHKLDSLAQDIENLKNKGEVYDIDSKITNLKQELLTIKNIIIDLNEVIASKVISTINDISFENESYDIKNHVSKMLSLLPQKEDIDKILSDGEHSSKAIDDLIEKTDIISEKIDNIPTKDDFNTLTQNLNIEDKLNDLSSKTDLEQLVSKTDEIEQMIDNLNFDDEFQNIYSKTSSIEEWLIDSKIKENAEAISKQSEFFANKEDISNILHSAEKIITMLEQTAQNTEKESLDNLLENVHSQFDELKTEIITSNESNKDSIINKLVELQNSLSSISTGEEFCNFIADLKDFTQTIVTGTVDLSENIEECKTLQKELLEKLDNIDFSQIISNVNTNLETFTNNLETNITNSNSELSNKISEVENKLTSLSEYINSNLNNDNEKFTNAIKELKEILENKKSNFDEIEQERNHQINSIEKYLDELKTILDTSKTSLTENTQNSFVQLENALSDYKTSTENQFVQIIEKLNEYETITTDKTIPVENISASFSEINEIKNQILKLGESFEALSEKDEFSGKEISSFVSEKLQEIGNNLENLTENVELSMQNGFAYNAELIEEKTAVLLDFIKELRHASTDNIELYERLTVTDNKLMDFQQELELINTDVISDLNSKTDRLLKELAPIKEMISCLSVQMPEGPQSEKVKEQLGILHESVQADIIECTKYSKSTFNKLEETYERISEGLINTENHLRDFILGDIDSVIIKVDNLKEELETSLSHITPPNAQQMEELHSFVKQISEFKNEQQEFLGKVADDIKTSITETVTAQHNEIKSMLTVAINNEEIVNAIDNLKKCFKSKIKELSRIQKESIEKSKINDEFATNQFEEVFEENNNAKVVAEIKEDFNKFSNLIGELSDENPQITEVLNSIREKIDTITVIKKKHSENILSTEDFTEDSEDSDFDIDESNENTNIDTDSIEEDDLTDNEQESDAEYDEDFEEYEDYDDDEEEILVGANNFDFIKAFDLLKQDINNLRSDIERVLPQQEQKKSISSGLNIPTLSNNNLLMSLNNKIELLSKTLNKDWLEEIKGYIEGSEIQSMLEEINGKIDILTLSDNSEWIEEIKQALDQLNGNDIGGGESGKEIQSMLALINEKIDILAASDDYDLMEDIRDAIERIYGDDINSQSQQNQQITTLLNTLDKKVDILAASDNYESIEDIKDSLDILDEKLDTLALSDNYDQINEIKDSLKTLEAKIDTIANISDNEYLDNLQETFAVIESKIEALSIPDNSNNVEDIKYTLLDVDEKVNAIKPVQEKVEKLSESDAKITSMLETLNHKIDIISSSEETFNKQQDIEDVKHLILAQMDYIEKLEHNNKTDAVKKCLKELTLEVNNLNLNANSNNKNVQKTLKDMKESIMAAVVTIFEQVSFIEESEDIKDFVEEKTDVINKNLFEVTKQLKQITNSNEDPDYTYSMQDIESDLAKLRLALNELQNNELETQSSELAHISDTLYRITSSVEELQSSMTQDEIRDLKNDIINIQEQTQKLLINSDESYNALNSGLEDFGKIITNQISTKVDNVTRLLEKSSDSDKVMRQALIYMGEWIDSASESMNKISTNSEEIIDIKTAIEGLKETLPEQTDILNSIEEKFDEQQERLSYFEKQISKLGALEDRFEEQQERIDRLEISLEKILSAVEEIDDSKVTRKIDKIDKQLAKLSTNIEKLASYVD